MNDRPARRLRVSRYPVAAAAGLMTTLAVLAGCTNAQLTDVWRDPGYNARPMRAILVVSQRRDATARRLWEDAISAELQKHGVRVSASYDQYPDAPATQQQMTDELKSGDFDGAIVERPLAATAQTSYVPGWSSIQPREYYNPWAGRDVIVYRQRYHRGYHVVDRILREQISIWSAEDPPRMIWGGTVEVQNPESSDQLRGDLSKALVPSLHKAGLI